MKTTILFLECLIGGILVLLALAVLMFSLFPYWIGDLSALSAQYEVLDALAPLLAAILVALAYGTGVVAEFLGELMFEWWLDRVKRARLVRYLRANSEVLYKSPLLVGCAPDGPAASSLLLSAMDADLIRQMRFTVRMGSEELYREIESQLNRFSLIRVLVLVDVLLTATAAVWFGRTPSAPLGFVLIVIVVFLAFNIGAVGRCFHRYCRAVEWAYKLLVLDV